MVETYNAYAFKSWKVSNPAATLIADWALKPLFEGLETTRLDLNARAVRVQRDVLNTRETWPRERTMNFTSSVWARIGGPKFQKMFDFELARHPVKPIPDHESPHMKSGGHCGLDGISYRFDGTLSDPVYMAHESGHQVAHRFGTYGPKNVCELQAFFAQEAGYDVLMRTMTDRGEAARLHRLEEFLNLQNERDYGLSFLNKDTPGNDEEDRAVYYLHQHVAAMPLAIYMYKIYGAMKPAEQVRALDALYNDKNANFGSISKAFGIKGGPDFLLAGTYAGNIMRNEAIALGLMTMAPAVERRAPALYRST